MFSRQAVTRGQYKNLKVYWFGRQQLVHESILGVTRVSLGSFTTLYNVSRFQSKGLINLQKY